MKTYEIYQKLKRELGRKPNRVEMFDYLMKERIYPKIKNTKYNPLRDYLGFLDNYNELSEEEKEVKEIAGDFLNMLERTKLTKSYKIPLLMAFIKGNRIAQCVSEDEIYESFKNFYNNPKYAIDMERHEKTKNFRNWSKKEYIKLAKENPIKYLLKTEGIYFKMEGSYFCLTEELKPVLDNKIFVEHYKDILEFRCREYFECRDLF